MTLNALVQATSRRGVPAVGAAAGSDAGFDACFQEYYARVLAYALRRLSSRSAAEDAAAETFLIAWRRRGEMPADPLPWLLTTARHQVYNEHRASLRRDRLLARVAREPRADDEPNEHPANGPADLDTARVTAALAQLSDHDREVLILTTWDGLDRARTAAVLGCSHGALAVRLHRARRRLARALDELRSKPEETE